MQKHIVCIFSLTKRRKKKLHYTKHLLIFSPCEDRDVTEQLTRIKKIHDAISSKIHKGGNAGWLQAAVSDVL